MRRGRGWPVVLSGVLVALAPGCSDDEEPRAGPTVELSSESSTFTVGHIPDGYVGVTAGEGTTGAAWGPDEDAGDEPFTVLSSDGTLGGEEVVVVAFTGYEGRQGGLDQANRGAGRRIDVDGHDAYFASASTHEGVGSWSDLVVDQGNDLAVRITSPDGSLEELQAVLPSVVIPTSHDHAPEVVDPPRGLEVVGSVDIDAVVALDPFVDPERRRIPGPRGSHSASWERLAHTRDQLVVTSIPGEWLDLGVVELAAFAERFLREAQPVDVHGQPGLVLESPYDNGDLRSRSILWVAPWGDVMIVHSRRDEEPLETEALLTVAESVERADEAVWDRFADELDGGPGFGADLSRQEVARGTVDGFEWLLQTSDPLISAYQGEGLEVGVDGCLKVSDGTRRCAGGGTWSGADSVQPNYEADPPFLIFTTDRPVGALQVVGFGGVPIGDRAKLVPVPGVDMRVAVIFLPPDKAMRCKPPVVEAEYSVRALAADGTDLGCADWGPDGVFGGI